MKFRTRAIHVGNPHDPQTGAVIPPVHLASTYVQQAAGEWGAFDYGRSGNPTRKNVETTLASLESGSEALAFASGMAAVHAVTMMLRPGDQILAGTDLYGGTYRLLHKIASRAGVQVKLVPSHDLDAVDREFGPQTRLLWLESPGNPLMTLSDIGACARIAHRHGALLAVDSTLATPVLTRPLELGADIVMHSATKYLGGHSDLIGGALVVGQRRLYDELYFIQNATGAVLGPWDCYLLARGLKTLDVRVREHSRSALQLAQWLQADPRVERVLYPGLPSHPGHELARRQMDAGFGGVLSFAVRGSSSQVRQLVQSTRLFQLAVSLGAVESLIEQPATMSHASYDAADRQTHGIVDGLVRLSVGLEDPHDLWDDLQQALAGALGKSTG